MTEDEARDWVLDHFGDRGLADLERLVALVAAESERQNLVARSTLDTIWARHIVDSAQLISLADTSLGAWLDIGSGAGFPGLVVAALTDRPVTLAEPRKRRATFLEDVAAILGVADRVSVCASKVESVRVKAAVISARAVAPLIDLFGAAAPCANGDTLWLMPKGQSAREEVAIARHAWHGAFHVEQSLTNPESLIVVARGVARRCKS
jgi:16S rRNA (guanine527-N7)-methyltransferase